MAITKSKETVLDKAWKETDKRNQAKAERIERLQKMLSESKEKYEKAEETYKAAEDALEPEAMIKARQVRDDARETMEMYRKAIKRAENEDIYTEEERQQIKIDLKMYASDMTGKRCTSIGEALEGILKILKEAEGERDRINDLYKTVFGPQTPGVARVQKTGLEIKMWRDITSAKMSYPQYFQRPIVRDGYGHIVDL